MPIAARRANVVLLLLTACGDEVVGYFDASTGSGSGTSSSTALATSSDTSGESTTGDGGFVAPGCFRDDFENGVVDPLWNVWMEEDATLEEIGGVLHLVPPSFGIWDTGIVGAYNYGFPFVDGHVRMRVPVPPDPARPVVLFLTVGDVEDTLVSMQLAGNEVIANATIGMVEQYREAFPVAAYPQWIGIRAADGQVHFETSDDGATWTALTTREQLGVFADSRALVMAQTYGMDTDRSAVKIDDFETCVQ
jgi:hypothetical protein